MGPELPTPMSKTSQDSKTREGSQANLSGCHRAGQSLDADQQAGWLQLPSRAAVNRKGPIPGTTTSSGGTATEVWLQPDSALDWVRPQSQVGSGETLQGHRALLAIECPTDAGAHRRPRKAVDEV